MFILWYSASSTFGKDSDIVMGVRAQQKEKTRRSLVEAAFSQLSAERSFASLSLREVAREAGIAPTSFYRHFRDVDELGLTMVDESGLMLRQLMRQARQRIAKGGSVIRTSVPHLWSSSVIILTPSGYYCGNAPAPPLRFVPPLRVKFSTSLRNLRTIWNSKTICRVRLLKRKPKPW